MNAIGKRQAALEEIMQTAGGGAAEINRAKQGGVATRWRMDG